MNVDQLQQLVRVQGELATIEALHRENDRYRAALEEIARHPLVERNPDGEDQAAHTMRLIAREALAANKETHDAS